MFTRASLRVYVPTDGDTSPGDRNVGRLLDPRCEKRQMRHRPRPRTLQREKPRPFRVDHGASHAKKKSRAAIIISGVWAGRKSPARYICKAPPLLSTKAIPVPMSPLPMIPTFSIRSPLLFWAPWASLPAFLRTKPAFRHRAAKDSARSFLAPNLRSDRPKRRG